MTKKDFRWPGKDKGVFHRLSSVNQDLCIAVCLSLKMEVTVFWRWWEQIIWLCLIWNSFRAANSTSSPVFLFEKQMVNNKLNREICLLMQFSCCRFYFTIANITLPHLPCWLNIKSPILLMTNLSCLLFAEVTGIAKQIFSCIFPG